MSHRPASVPARRSSLSGFRFPPEVIVLAVRWYLRYGLSYRDVEELLAERGITVDHVTIYRWVQRAGRVHPVPGHGRARADHGRAAQRHHQRARATPDVAKRIERDDNGNIVSITEEPA